MGKVNLADAYARIESDEAWLVGAHIAPFEGGNRYNHEPKRTRKLLLHRSRDRRAARPGQGEGPDDRAAAAVHHRQGPGEGRARAGARQAAPRPAARHRRPRRASATWRASSPTSSAAGRLTRSSRIDSGSARSIEAVDAHAAGEPGRVIVGGVEDVPGAHDVRQDDLAPGEPRRPPAADAARAARLPGRELQPDPAVEPSRGGRRLRDHGAGRVPGHVRHEHDVRRHRPARDRDAADARAGHRAGPRGAGRAHPGHAPTCRDGKVTGVTFRNVPAFATHIDAPVEVPQLGTVDGRRRLRRDVLRHRRRRARSGSGSPRTRAPTSSGSPR